MDVWETKQKGRKDGMPRRSGLVANQVKCMSKLRTPRNGKHVHVALLLRWYQKDSVETLHSFAYMGMSQSGFWTRPESDCLIACQQKRVPGYLRDSCQTRIDPVRFPGDVDDTGYQKGWCLKLFVGDSSKPPPPQKKRRKRNHPV